jgi:hypothetical protein
MEKLQIMWYKKRFLQMSETQRLPKLIETKLIHLENEINGINGLLKENKTDITDINHLIHAAASYYRNSH